MKKWRAYWPFLPLLILAAAGVIGWFTLPAELTLRTQGSSLPKLLGLLGPVAAGAFGGSLAAREKTRWAGAVVIVIAVITEIMLFAWNL